VIISEEKVSKLHTAFDIGANSLNVSRYTVIENCPYETPEYRAEWIAGHIATVFNTYYHGIFTERTYPPNVFDGFMGFMRAGFRRVVVPNE